MNDGPHVVVLGAMGIGKSTTARALATRLGRPERDSDRDIETLFGVPGRALADQAGVPELHRLERAVLLGALAGPDPTVISAAASIVEDPRCREALSRRAFTVVLDADIDEVTERMATGAHRRSMSREELEKLIERRRPLFQEAADLRLEATLPTPELVDAIHARLRSTRSSVCNTGGA
jgi:shikimate kinase